VTDTRPPLPRLIVEGRVIAVARHVSPLAAPGIAEALAAGGVLAMEVTLNEPQGQALEAVAALARASASLGALAGAGTVTSVSAAERAVDAGAAFIVTPHTDPAIVRWCVSRAVPCLPGALTPTEIQAAWEAGASAVKLFPAGAVGPAYLSHIAGPFPDIPLVPTGGVSAEDAADWIAAGAVAVGMGGWLIGDGDRAGITERARRVRTAVSDVADGGPR
jgi:2-dehydro-3-deoxyphosphogluconate aldolase / (4S)-4-hydroxy-2-oxoglutarate aldolase